MIQSLKRGKQMPCKNIKLASQYHLLQNRRWHGDLLVDDEA